MEAFLRKNPSLPVLWSVFSEWFLMTSNGLFSRAHSVQAQRKKVKINQGFSFTSAFLCLYIYFLSGFNSSFLVESAFKAVGWFMYTCPFICQKLCCELSVSPALGSMTERGNPYGQLKHTALTVSTGIKLFFFKGGRVPLKGRS